MKAFIKVDLEGMPYIVNTGHLNLDGKLYNEARKIATKVTLIVAEELNNNGFDGIIISDSHGPCVAILVDDLPEYVEIIRGYPRPGMTASGVEECDAALFLGYHAKHGTAKSTFDHTYSPGTIMKVEVNGIPVSEYLINAFVVGEYNVPAILVAGEAKLLKDDVKKYTPWTETVSLKSSMSRVSARSYNMVKIEKELRDAVIRAVTNFNQKKAKPLIIEKPVKTRITFLASHFADTAELLPIVNRIDGLNIEYTAKNMIEAYKIFLLLLAAAHGVTLGRGWL